MSEKRVSRIIDDHFPPGSEERLRLDAAAENAKRLLIKHGHGHLLEEPGETPAAVARAGLASAASATGPDAGPETGED